MKKENRVNINKFAQKLIEDCGDNRESIENICKIADVEINGKGILPSEIIAAIPIANTVCDNFKNSDKNTMYFGALMYCIGVRMSSNQHKQRNS